MKIKTDILVRIYFTCLPIVVCAIAVLLKGYQIQNYKDGYWKKEAREMTTRYFKEPAERGNIYASDGSLLATSIPYFDLRIDFAASGMTKTLFENNVDSLSIYLANKFQDKSAKQYKQELIKARRLKKRYFLLKRDIDYATLKEIQKWPLFREGKNSGGLIPISNQTRMNPYALLSKRTIGEYRTDTNSVGLEASYNAYLKGAEGNILKQKIGGGIWIPIMDSTILPQKGMDIMTTLDINLQDIAETALMKAVDSSQADFGCAVVMEVATGEIKAIANLGKTKSGQYWEIENYAVSHRSEPGSTFKAVSYLMLIDKNGLNINDSVNINGGKWNFYGRTMYDDHFGKQYISVKDAFASSSNVAAAKLIDKYYKNNKKGFYKNMQTYGMTEASGIDLKGEKKPNITKPNSWSNLSLPWRATGYEQTFSPLQILTFYNTIANKGYRVKPHLVKEVSQNGEIIKKISPIVSSKPIAKPQSIQALKELMKWVVESPHGTARNIRSPYFKLAGKTGTAKILDRTTGRYSNANKAMFAGFFPFENPRYSCIVMVYHPKGIYRTGGNVAAPVFKEIAEKALATDMQVAPTYPVLVNKEQHFTQIKGDRQQVETILSKYGYKTHLSDKIGFVNAEISQTGIKLLPLENSGKTIPNVIGMNLDDALYLLENIGLKVQFSGVGKIYAQSLPPHTKIKGGESILLTMKIDS